jgi:hypothetical protein
MVGQTFENLPEQRLDAGVLLSPEVTNSLQQSNLVTVAIDG